MQMATENSTLGKTRRTHQLPMLADRVIGVPLMIHPQKLKAILSVDGLASRILGDNIHLPGIMNALPSIGSGVEARDLATRFAQERVNLNIDQRTLASFDDDDDDELEYSSGAAGQTNSLPYQLTSSGIAVVGINGTLVKKASGMMAWSGMCSYTSIKAQLLHAADNSAVRGIMLNVDSPGGETHGCFDLSDLIYSLRGTKPIYASINDRAASAAYCLASAADRIYTTRTGAAGSIGVYMLHADVSESDKKMGVKYTYIFAGKNKVAGNPHAALSDKAEAYLQAEVDRQYGMFVGTVARNRKASSKAIIDTNAECLFGDNALGLLADSLGTFEVAMYDLEKKAGATGSSVNPKVRGAKPAVAAKVDSADAAVEIPVVEALVDPALAATTAAVLVAGAAPAPNNTPAPDPTDRESDNKNPKKDGDSGDPDDDNDDDTDNTESCDEEDDDEVQASTSASVTVLTASTTTDTGQGPDSNSVEGESNMSKPNDNAAPAQGAGAVPNPIVAEAAVLATVAAAASTGPNMAGVQEITDLCGIAGLSASDQTAYLTDYGTSKKSVADIRAEIRDKRIAASNAGALNPNHQPTNAGAAAASGVTNGVSDALIKLNDLAIAMSRDKGIPVSRAFHTVCHQNPELYKAVREHKADIASASGTQRRQYMRGMTDYYESAGAGVQIGGTGAKESIGV